MIGLLFPGQGSQHVEMGEFLLKGFPRANSIFEEASDILGYDMKELCLEGPEDKLKKTEFTQPALLTTSFATYRVLRDMGEDWAPHATAGHSVGEYAALVISGVIPFKKAIELVQLRGQLMQKAVPVGEGAMTAVVGVGPEDVIKICNWAKQTTNHPGPLEPANFNAPKQTVISGKADLMQWLITNFRHDRVGLDDAKIKLIPLKVSAPFHCAMMKPAEEAMAKAINAVEFKDAQIPIAQNFTGKLEQDPVKLKENLIKQISGPVRWVECMEALRDHDVTLLGECGPGTVLAGLCKKIDEKLNCTSLNSLGSLQGFNSSADSHAESMRRKAEFEKASKEEGDQ